MGYDVEGIEPDSPDEGHDIHFTIWEWGPIWDFCCRVGEEALSERDMKAGYYNDGHEYPKEKALALARGLKDAIGNKPQYDWEFSNRKNYVEKHVTPSHPVHFGMSILATLGGSSTTVTGDLLPFDWGSIEKFANFCEHSGGFRIY